MSDIQKSAYSWAGFIDQHKRERKKFQNSKKLCILIISYYVNEDGKDRLLHL